MNPRKLVPRILLILGLVAMLVGAVDPLEGSPLILVGSILAAAGALLARSRYRGLLCAASALVAFGVGAMIVLTWLGGIGGDSGRSMWWGCFILPYPIGWLMGLAAAVASGLSSQTSPPTREPQKGVST
jgi:hypothetical protein